MIYLKFNDVSNEDRTISAVPFSMLFYARIISTSSYISTSGTASFPKFINVKFRPPIVTYTCFKLS